MNSTSKAKLAALLGITTRRIEQLANEGVLVRSRGGDFDLEESVPKYCNYLRRDDETRQERRKLLRVQSKAVAIRAQANTGRLITRKEVRRLLRSVEARMWNLRVVSSWLWADLKPFETRAITHD